MKYCIHCLLLFLISVTFVKGNVVDALSNLLPLAKGIRLGMSLNDFKQINQTATDIGAKLQSKEKNGNRIYGEEIGKGEISLTSQKTFYYYFISGKLTRIEWKDKTGSLGVKDAKKFSKHLEEALGKPKKEKTSFFGGDEGAFKTTEEIFGSLNRVELRLVASKPFFYITVTDLDLISQLDKEEVFDKLSDNFAIQEWNQKNSESQLIPKYLKTIDFLANSSTSRREVIKPDVKDEKINQDIPGNFSNNKKSTKEVTRNSPKIKQDRKSIPEKKSFNITWIIVGLLVIGLTFLVLKKWSGARK